MLDISHVLALTFGLAFVVVILFAVPSRRRTEVVLCLYFFSLCFSGIENRAIGQGFEFLRLGCVWMIAAQGFRRPIKPGLAISCLAASSVMLLLRLPSADNPIFAILFVVGMLIMSVPFAWAIAGVVADDERRNRTLRHLAYASVVYVALAVAGIGSGVGGRRFTGSGDAPAVFAMTGALFLPVLLWGLLFGERRFRVFSTVMLVPVAAFTILSGQRVGPVVAIVSILPFVVYAATKVSRRTLLLTALGCAGAYLVINGAAFQFSLDRLRSFDTNGRDERWRRGIELILASPFGHGPGTGSSTGFGLHNAYLAAAYEGGVLAGLLWLISSVVALVSAVRAVIVRSVGDGTALLCLGWLAGTITGALVENKLYSPTNFAIFTFVFAAVTCHHLNRSRRAGTPAERENATPLESLTQAR